MAKRLNALLPAARWTVIGLAAAILLISIIGLVRFPDYAARHLAEFTPDDSWTRVQTQQALAELGWSPLTPAWFDLGLNFLYLLVFYSIAFILWRKSRDWFGLFLLFVFIIMGPSGGTIIKPAAEILPFVESFERIFGGLSWQFFFLLFYFFPNSRPVPRWTRWFVAFYSVYMLAALVIDELSISSVGGVFSIMMVVLAIGSQGYRYFRRSNPIQRQQTRWVMYALAIALVDVVFMLAFAFQSPPPDALGSALVRAYVFRTTAILMFLVIPLSITFAVLRYRLWDLDILIRRTLVYTALTAALGLVYFGSVVLIQLLFQPFSGQNSPLVVVLSTLAIAALFTPLRRRMQAAIDRRFYRKKYDAEQAVAAFAATARNETALHAITGQMVSVVEENVHPEQVWVWLKDGSKNL